MRSRFKKNKISILDLAIDLMIRLVRGHFLSNGNKRLGIISCGAFLASVGLYLKWNNNKVQYLNNWEKIFVIEIKSENDNITPEKTASLFRAYKNISKVMNNQNYIFLIIKVDTYIKPYEFNIYKWCNGEIEEHLKQYTLENAFN